PDPRRGQIRELSRPVWLSSFRCPCGAPGERENGERVARPPPGSADVSVGPPPRRFGRNAELAERWGAKNNRSTEASSVSFFRPRFSDLHQARLADSTRLVRQGRGSFQIPILCRAASFARKKTGRIWSFRSGCL